MFVKGLSKEPKEKETLRMTRAVRLLKEVRLPSVMEMTAVIGCEDETSARILMESL